MARKKDKPELFDKSDKWELRSAYAVLRGWVTGEFLKAWEMWVDHRKEMRKPMTETAVRLQLERFKKGTPEEAVAAIEHSIASGYRGIFPPPASQGQRAGRNAAEGFREFLQ